MTKKKTTVALIYDFDGTLSPGNMQEFGFMKAIGHGVEEFWKKNNQLALENDANGILCYMYLMLEEAKHQNISLKRESFRSFGKEIKFFDGVESWFQLINAYGESLGLEIEHYINSSGLKEMVEGTRIAHEFKGIYACSFLYNIDGIAYWPAVAVDYTGKTQFLFKINKGIESVSDNKRINEYCPEEERSVPFKRMIFLGDGETDIPCMKLVKEQGGCSIAVYQACEEEKKATAMKLIDENRVNFVCPADYCEGKEMHQVVKTILEKIKSDQDFEDLKLKHKSKSES